MTIDVENDGNPSANSPDRRGTWPSLVGHLTGGVTDLSPPEGAICSVAEFSATGHARRDRLIHTNCYTFVSHCGHFTLDRLLGRGSSKIHVNAHLSTCWIVSSAYADHKIVYFHVESEV